MSLRISKLQAFFLLFVMLATTALLLVLGWLTPLAHSYWMKDIAHQGISPFNTDKNYQVFRNVKDFGAKGDGGELEPAVSYSNHSN